MPLNTRRKTLKNLMRTSGHGPEQLGMNQQKCKKLKQSLRVLRDALLDLRSFRQHWKVWLWALAQHPDLEEDGGVLGSHLVGVHGEASAVLIRRVVKPSSGISLLDFLRDVHAFYAVASACFPGLPPAQEVAADANALEAATAEVIALVDKAYVHLDRPTAHIPLWEAFTKRDEAFNLTIATLEKYIGLLSRNDVPSQVAVSASEIRALFGQRWIDPEADIPPELTEGESLFGT